MAKDVYVALWHLDTRADPGANEPSLLRKLLALRRAITTASNHFNTLGDTGGDEIRLFAAPEYFFAKGGDYIQAYSEDEKNAIKRSLQEISAQYPLWIFCPGTVAWKEPLDRTRRKAIAAGLQTRINDPALADTGYRREVSEARENIKTGKAFWKSNSSSRWFGHNSAFIYQGGILVGEINKAGNASEFNGEADNVVMIPGFRSGKFEIPFVSGTDPASSLKLGLEICADAGRLISFGEEVDIHVLISASNIGQSPAARPGGLYVHCDSNNPPRVRTIQEVAGPVSNYTDFSPGNIVGDNHIADADLYACRVQLADRPAPLAR